MQAFQASYLALAISAIYIIWRNYTDIRIRHQRMVRDRLAYMLWVMAHQCE
jgi:hypothetical protein